MARQDPGLVDGARESSLETGPIDHALGWSRFKIGVYRDLKGCQFTPDGFAIVESPVDRYGLPLSEDERRRFVSPKQQSQLVGCYLGVLEIPALFIIFLFFYPSGYHEFDGSVKDWIFTFIFFVVIFRFLLRFKRAFEVSTAVFGQIYEED